MGNRYFIELSRSDTGLVSYFPGLEVKDDANGDWIEKVLVPAVEPIAKRKSAKIRDIPITFWSCVRGTVRRRAEVFLFVTPAYPGAAIEQTLRQALQPIIDGKVHAGRERLPKDAFPCLQVFRGKLIRFYCNLKNHYGYSLPTVCWKDKSPELELLPISENDELIAFDVPTEDLELFLAEAMVISVSNGE